MPCTCTPLRRRTAAWTRCSSLSRRVSFLFCFVFDSFLWVFVTVVVVVSLGMRCNWYSLCSDWYLFILTTCPCFLLKHSIIQPQLFFFPSPSEHTFRDARQEGHDRRLEGEVRRLVGRQQTETSDCRCPRAGETVGLLLIIKRSRGKKWHTVWYAFPVLYDHAGQIF